MKFWWFKFEGWFSESSREFPGQGVFSECLVPADNHTDAESRFYSALAEREINVIEIEDSFMVDTSPESMDPEDPDNLFWIEWSEQTELAGTPTFEAFHLYPAKEVTPPQNSGN